jgi:hypothetical protein
VLITGLYSSAPPDAESKKMGAGTKVLAGCGCLAILAATVLVAGLGLGLFWLKDWTRGLEKVRTRSQEIDRWEREANAHPWEPPDDGVLAEPRVQAFLDVRRRVHDVYETYEDELEQLRKRLENREGPPTLGDVLSTGGTAVEMFEELRLAQVRARAEAKMSEAEYHSIRTALYVAAAVSRAEARTGRRPAEAVSEATREVQEAVRAGLEAARREGLPGAGDLSEADLRNLQEALSQAGKSGTEALTVPPENVELYRKHQAEIDRYAMHGLALLGL